MSDMVICESCGHLQHVAAQCHGGDQSTTGPCQCVRGAWIQPTLHQLPPSPDVDRLIAALDANTAALKALESQLWRTAK